MLEKPLKPLPSALQLTELIEELPKLIKSVVRLMDRERVRLYVDGRGAFTPTDWSRLQSAVALLREMSAGERCSAGAVSVARFHGGRRT